MITCHVTYKIDPAKVESFEAYAKAWIPLVERFGGTRHGYFLPHERANCILRTIDISSDLFWTVIYPAFLINRLRIAGSLRRSVRTHTDTMLSLSEGS